MSRVKRSYQDMFSSSSTSPPSAHFSSDPHTDLSLAHKRSRPLESTQLTRQMSTDNDMLSSLTTSLAHDKITSDALRLSAPTAASSPSASLHPLSPLASSSSSTHSHSRSISPEEPSRFPSRHRSFDVHTFVESYPLKRKRNHSNMDLSSAGAPTQPLFSPNKEQRVLPLSSSSTSNGLTSSLPSASLSASQPQYSLEQVKRIVKSALQLQEDKLREEYNAALTELLREQFENFDRFNKDYISRQLRNTDLSYLS